METIEEKVKRLARARYQKGQDIGQKFIEAHRNGASIVYTPDRTVSGDEKRGVMDALLAAGLVPSSEGEVKRVRFSCHCCACTFHTDKPQDPQRDTGYGTCNDCHDMVAESWVKHGFPDVKTMEDARARLAKYA